MDDKERVRRLYNRMVRINRKTSNLIDSIEYFEDDLSKALKINNKTYEINSILNKKSNVKRVKSSIKYNVINNLAKYL